MKSRNFKKILSTSIAFLAVLSTLSGSISNKIYATEPETIENVDNNLQKICMTCSYKGYNIIFGYNVSLSDKSNIELVNQFAKKFRKITINCPFDKKIPKEKLVFYDIENTQINFEIMREFLSITNPKEQKECVEEYLESVLKKFNEKQKEVQKDEKASAYYLYDYNGVRIFKKSENSNALIPEKCIDINALSSEESINSDETISKRSDGNVIINFNKSDNDDKLSYEKSDNYVVTQHKKVPTYMIKCLYKKRSFIFTYHASPKGKAKKKILIQFIKKFKKIFDRYLFNKETSKKVIFNAVFEKVLDNPEIMEQFLSIERTMDQIKFIETFLTDEAKLTALKYDESKSKEIVNFCSLDSSEPDFSESDSSESYSGGLLSISDSIEPDFSESDSSRLLNISDSSEPDSSESYSGGLLSISDSSEPDFSESDSIKLFNISDSSEPDSSELSDSEEKAQSTNEIKKD